MNTRLLPMPAHEVERDLDDICTRIAGGETMTAIAESFGITKGAFSMWVACKPERSARVRSAREIASTAWDEDAEREIRAAADPFELAKARDLAHHLRWRASAISPDYSSKETRKHEIGESITALERRIVDPAAK